MNDSVVSSFRMTATSIQTPLAYEYWDKEAGAGFDMVDGAGATDPAAGLNFTTSAERDRLNALKEKQKQSGDPGLGKKINDLETELGRNRGKGMRDLEELEERTSRAVTVLALSNLELTQGVAQQQSAEPLAPEKSMFNKQPAELNVVELGLVLLLAAAGVGTLAASR